jgi:small-conductance mechanosensitive channel
MTQYLHQFVLFAAAVVIGGLAFVPTLATARRKLLWSAGLLTGSALLWQKDGKAFPLDTVLPNSSFFDAAFRVLLWSVVALLGVTFVRFALNWRRITDLGPPRAGKLFSDLLSGLIYVIAASGILEAIFGIPLSGLLATSGIIAIVVGLALQNTLTDLFSGLALNLERPFHAGDWIEISGGPEGEIIEGNWRATRLRTRAGDLVVVPNAVLAKSVVTNRYWPSRIHAASAVVTFGHDLDPNVATDVLLEATQDQSLDLADPPPSVSMLSWGPLGISYSLGFYVADYADAPGTTDKVLRAIWHTAKKRGLSFAPSLPVNNTFAGEYRTYPATANLGPAEAQQQTCRAPN